MKFRKRLGICIISLVLILLAFMPIIMPFSGSGNGYSLPIGYGGATAGNGSDGYSMKFTLSTHPLSSNASFNLSYEDGYTVSLGYIHMLNTKANITEINETPLPVFFGNIIRCEANITDIDSDSLTAEFNITSPSNRSFNSTGVADSGVWYSDFVAINESGNWTCVIKSYDGYDYSINSKAFAAAKKTGAISTTVGDLPFYSITANPLNISHQSCLSELKANAQCNQSWDVNATGYLETKWLFFVIYNSSYSNVLTSSINITIVGNATPIITTPIISPVTAYTNDTLSCSFLVFDWDTENITANVTWYVNNIVNQTEQLNCTERQTCYTNNNITSSSTTKLNNWTCSINADDNISLSGWKNSTMLTVSNKAPDAPVLNSPENERYIASNSSLLNWTVTDIDDDAMTCYVYAQNITDPSNIVNVTSGVTNGSYYLYNWTNLNDAVYYWKVRCDDASENSSFLETRSFTIDTTVPEISLILPDNKTGDNDGNLSFSYNVTDTNSVTNCSLIFNTEINITNTSITKDITSYFYSYDTDAGQYNWSVNCTDNTGNVGESKERVVAVILTTEYDDTLNFSSLDVFNLTDMYLTMNGYGKMNFTNITDLSSGADLDKEVNISFNWIEINSSAVKGLNKSATLLLYNLTFTNPRILRNGGPCSSEICEENYYVNVSVKDSRRNLSFNVTRFTAYSAGETPVPGPVIERSAEGTGEGTGMDVRLVKKFSVDKELMKVELKQGDTKEEMLVITNEGDTELSFSINTIGLEEMILVMDDKFVLQPKESKEVLMYLTASEEQPVKLYTGKLLITANYLMKMVGVVIDVTKKKPLFDINVKVHNVTKKVLKGEDVGADITMINVGDLKNVDVIVNYAIRDVDGNTINFREETMAVREKLSITRRLKLPEEIEYGTYLFYAEVKYGEEKAISTDIFDVVEVKSTVQIERYIGIRDFREYILFILLVIICILLIIIGYRPVKDLAFKIRSDGLRRGTISLSERKLEIEKKFKQIESVEVGISIERFSNLLLSIISNMKENRIDEETINKYNKLVSIYNDLRVSKIKRKDKMEIYKRVKNIRNILGKYVR